jgi:hypothetical protein
VGGPWAGLWVGLGRGGGWGRWRGCWQGRGWGCRRGVQVGPAAGRRTHIHTYTHTHIHTYTQTHTHIVSFLYRRWQLFPTNLSNEIKLIWQNRDVFTLTIFCQTCIDRNVLVTWHYWKFSGKVLIFTLI